MSSTDGSIPSPHKNVKSGWFFLKIQKNLIIWMPNDNIGIPNRFAHKNLFIQPDFQFPGRFPLTLHDRI